MMSEVMPGDRSDLGANQVLASVVEQLMGESTPADVVAMLQTVVDLIPLPVFVQGQDDVYLICNRAFAEDICGLSVSAMVGKSARQLGNAVPSALTMLTVRDLEQAVPSGPVASDVLLDLSDGRLSPSRLSVAPIRDKSGRLVGMVGTLVPASPIGPVARTLPTVFAPGREQTEALHGVVRLVREEMGYDAVALYAMREHGRRLSLIAAEGAVGDMPADLPVADSSIVVRCLSEQQPVRGKVLVGSQLERPADTDASLLVWPLSADEPLGVLVIRGDSQKLEPSEVMATLALVADRVRAALGQMRLNEALDATREELQRVQQRYTLEMLDEHLEERDVLGFEYDQVGVKPLTLSEVDQDFLPTSDGGSEAVVQEPLRIRGEKVGLLTLEEPAQPGVWTEEQSEILEAVREQLELALENRLLIERSQRALREARRREAELAFLQEISAMLNATSDVAGIGDALLEQLQGFVPVDTVALVSLETDEASASVLGGAGDFVSDYVAIVSRVPKGLTAVSRVVERRTSLIQNDLGRSPRFAEDAMLARLGITARALFPLTLGPRLLGVLDLASRKPDAFSREGIAPVLQQVAAQVASAIERGNLLKVAQASADESRRLYEATADLVDTQGAPGVLEAIATHIFSHRPARAEIALYVGDPETGAERDWMEIVASLTCRVDRQAPPTGTRLRVEELIAPTLVEGRGLFVTTDVESDPNLPESLRSVLLEEKVTALVVAALTTGGDAAGQIGVLQVRYYDSQGISAQEERLYRTLADQAAVVLANRRLFEESQARIRRQEAAVELANLTTSFSERGPLMQASVDFLQRRFDLHFAGIFLLDTQGEWAVLQSGTGDIGQRLMLMGHRVRVVSSTMVGSCIRSGKRVVALDLDPQNAVLENPLLPKVRSAIAFPLVSRGQVNGALVLQSDRRFAFTQDDVAILELMANQLANVIESANLYERSQNSLAETRMLYRIAQQVTDARDAESVLRAAVEGIAQRREPDWVIAGLLEPQASPKSLRLVVVWNREGLTLPRSAFDLDEIRQFYEVLRLDERFVTPDITQDPLVDDSLRRLYSQVGIRATAAFQLKVRGAQHGTIIIHSQTAREFSTAELSFYENVARQAFVALENINLVEVTREQAERRDVLNQILRSASSSLDQQEILQGVGEIIARRLGVPVATWEWNGRSLAMAAVHDIGGRLVVGGDKRAAVVDEAFLCQLQRVVEAQQPDEVSFPANGCWAHVNDGEPLLLAEEGFAVPLVARNAVYGVMVLMRSTGAPPLGEADKEFMRTVGANVSVALETASLYRDAQETAEKLREVDKLKNQFMANMSHELRTPLNSIIGFSRVMLKGIDGPLTEMQETDLNAIYESGRHLLNLINDILDISKINAGKMEVVFEPVDLKRMIQSVMSTAVGFVRDKPIKLLTDVPDDLPVVVADERRIRQVLTNLLGNAGKFTEEGFIKVSATYDDYQVVISVQDTGIGIPADRIHAVFEQFEQVDSSSTRRYGGTGLGVPLSREFVRLHGGDMWIQETEVGKGTTFSFSLPIGGPDAIQEEERMDPGPLGRVVLTVDDDPTVITLFRRYLEREGYRVFGLTDGRRVLAEAKRLKPYAITLDVIMPGMDGWQVVQALRSDPETRDIPIIICSILSEMDRGVSLGVADYLVKPISEESLLSALARLTEKGSGAHVLIVDDSADDRHLLRRILEGAGYLTSEVGGGVEALEWMQNHVPDLVILDLMMPEVDGFAVLEQLRREPRTRSLPVVVVTAKDLTEDERAILYHRVEALLQKGMFDQDQLLADVSEALSRLRPQAYTYE